MSDNRNKHYNYFDDEIYNNFCLHILLLFNEGITELKT